MSRLYCPGDVSVGVPRPEDRLPIGSESRTDTASRRPRALDQRERSVAGEEEEGEEDLHTEMTFGATDLAAIRQTAALRLGDAGARVTTAGVRAAALHHGEESVTTVRQGVVVEGVAQAIRSTAIGALAGTGATVGIAVAGDVEGCEALQIQGSELLSSTVRLAPSELLFQRGVHSGARQSPCWERRWGIQTICKDSEIT